MATYEEVNSNDRLSFTLFLAVAVHAVVILGLTFSIDKGVKVAPTLNITIATHDSKKAPEKADFLAQHNQEGSGTADKVKEITTREMANYDDIRIKDVNPPPQKKASEPRDPTSQQLITTLRDVQKHTHQQPEHKQKTKMEEAVGEEFEIQPSELEYSSLRAKLDRLRQDLANKPRIYRLTSVSSKASHDAKYLSEWAQKIEIIGNKNFPQAAIDQKIFGTLRLMVSLKPNGVVNEVEILKSSGHSILDQAAIQIVRLASPFNPLPPEIRKDHDILEIIRTWRFEITGLSTTN